MTLSEFSIKRPVAAMVFNMIIIAFGIVGFYFVGIRLYPAIDPPTISVQTNYTGANADIIESQITEPLEKAINGIEGVRSITSSSSIGRSNITVEFNVGVDLEKAANDVRDKVSQATRMLPLDIDAPPTVTKSDADSDPVITLSVLSTTMSAIELGDYAENILQEKLQTIPGVSGVNLFGLRRPAMRLWLDPAKMAACNITPVDVGIALGKENVELPGGKIVGASTELIVRTSGRLFTEEDFDNLILRRSGDQIIRLSDVGESILGPENTEVGIKLNGVNGISLALLPLPGANIVAIADEFYRRFDAIGKNLPQGLQLNVGYDRTKFVRAAIHDVTTTVIIAFLLVIAIIFLFFRSWLMALRPLIDIPVSLIGSFFIMYIAGFSINVLTLLAIVLATGLVVDDGIVVTENIFKKVEKGMDVFTAAIAGTREVFFAVISTTITLAAVFIPVVFLQGFTGRLFREFGIVLAGTVCISSFVALTLTPVLNVKMGRGISGHSRFYRATEPFFVALENAYRSALAFVVGRFWIALLILVVCTGAIFFFLGSLKSELAPLEDHSIVRGSITLPEGTSFDYASDFVDRVAQVTMDSVPEARLIFSGAGFGGGTNRGAVQAFLVEPNERTQSQQQIFDRITRIYRRFSEGRIIANQEPTISTSIGAGRQLPVQFVVQNLDFKKLHDVLPQFLDEAHNDPTFANVDMNLKFNKPELNLSVDRLKATGLGVNISDVSTTLQYALSGRRYDYFLRNGKQYQVIGQVDRTERSKPADIAALYVRNSQGQSVQLDNIVTVTESSGPPALYHYNRYKAATVSATLAPGKTLGEGIAAMKRIAGKLLDESFNTDLAGESRDFAESGSNILFGMVLALVLVYLVLSAQFESFRDPLIIMITVPLAMAGALFSLWVSGQTLNIFSNIAMIMLIGLVTKNGILIVEFSNQQRLKGLQKKDAVIEGAAARLRPILMTSTTTILGALPIALGLGAGAESRMPLGIVVVGGMTFSLVLTLFVIPSMYLLIAKKTNPQLLQATGEPA
jgi:hydrophobe/amphiphile efflux-1 (HAE1) family protein